MTTIMTSLALLLAQDPAATNVRGAKFPAVDAEGRVTVKLKAPDAQSVQVRGKGALWGGKAFPLERGADGTWSGTSEPAEPGFFYYEVLIDGVAVNDPGSETFFGWGRQTSGIEIPERGVDFHHVKAVPHGEVRVRTYESKVTGTARRVFVYTPPDYDREPTKRWPVLYLQHGSGESERAWTQQGRAQFILDNLIAEAKAVPMIVVMENGYATKAGAAPAEGSRGNEGFEALVEEDLVPMIDATYRTIASRGSRAIAGLSMGGGQAIRIGLGHPELFGAVGSLSGGAGSRRGGARPEPIAKALADPAAFNARGQFLWIGCGRQDGGYAGAKDAHEALDRAGVKHAWFECEGAHEWGVWRKSLYDLAQKLFRG
jgi:enterochelin esterase-like enzyme